MFPLIHIFPIAGLTVAENVDIVFCKCPLYVASFPGPTQFSVALLYWKQQKARRGLGTRLPFMWNALLYNLLPPPPPLLLLNLNFTTFILLYLPPS